MDTDGVRGISRHWIPLPEETPGTEITLRSNTGVAYFEQTIKGNSYLGDKASVYARFFEDNLYALLFALLALSSSILVFFFLLRLDKQYPNGIRKGLLQLGFFMMSTGIWILSDSQVIVQPSPKLQHRCTQNAFSTHFGAQQSRKIA